MEQSSDLIIQGRALADFYEVAELHLSETEYRTRIETGESLPLGASVIIHDDDWLLVEQLTLLPVEVLEVIEGETHKQIINVVQHDDWGSIPMKKDAEYLLFLQQPLPSVSARDFYYNFYGQGTYNLDGTDPRISSAGYYDAEAVEDRYGSRVEFAVLPSEKNVSVVQTATKDSKATRLHRWLSRIHQWFKAD